MQNAILAVVMGASLLGLALVAMFTNEQSGRATWPRLAIGASIGLVAAAVTLSLRTDLVPDDIEFLVGAVLLITITAGMILVFLHRTR